MKTIDINGALRKDISKQEVKGLRENEQVPCVLYGGDEQIHFSVTAFDVRDLIYTHEVHMVNLNLEGKTYKAVLQDIQFHPVTDAIHHMDFLLVIDDKPMTMSIPVQITGVSEGVRQGGKLVVKMRRMKVKALPAALPDFVTVDISPLKIGGSTRVRDLNIDGVTFLDSPANVVVGVRTTRNVAAEATADKK